MQDDDVSHSYGLPNHRAWRPNRPDLAAFCSLTFYYKHRRKFAASKMSYNNKIQWTEINASRQ